jgi:hypothetical protein
MSPLAAFLFYRDKGIDRKGKIGKDVEPLFTILFEYCE